MWTSLSANSGNSFILHLNLRSGRFLKDRAIWNLKHINKLFVIFYIKILWFILHFGRILLTASTGHLENNTSSLSYAYLPNKDTFH